MSMSAQWEEDLFAPAEALLELICSPEGSPLDCHDVAVVVAHPDDETIAIGGQLARMRGVKIVHVTDGAPADMKDAEANGFSRREDYAAARRRDRHGTSRFGRRRAWPGRLASGCAVNWMSTPW